jgi:hypothetical protein
MGLFKFLKKTIGAVDDMSVALSSYDTIRGKVRAVSVAISDGNLMAAATAAAEAERAIDEARDALKRLF